VFKYTGELAKFKSTELKHKAQLARSEVLNTDHMQYLEILKQMLQDEEKAYTQSSSIIFE